MTGQEKDGKIVKDDALKQHFVEYTVGTQICAPSSGGVYLEFNGGFELRYIFDHPTSKEKNEFRNGAPQFSFAVVDDVIFFLSRFGMLNWTDSPFNVHLYPGNPALQMEIPTSTQGIALQAMLIDADTGVLIRQRLIGIEHDLSMRLLDAIAHQPEIPDYEQRLELIMAEYTTTDLLALGQHNR